MGRRNIIANLPQPHGRVHAETSPRLHRHPLGVGKDLYLGRTLPEPGLRRGVWRTIEVLQPRHVLGRCHDVPDAARDVVVLDQRHVWRLNHPARLSRCIVLSHNMPKRARRRLILAAEQRVGLCG